MKKFIFVIAIALIALQACKKKEDVVPPTPPVSNFTFKIDTTRYPSFVVDFTNSSTNAKTYSWNFGDGNTSADINPIHTFSNAGTFHVVLTSVGDGGSNTVQKDVGLGLLTLSGASFTAESDVTVASVNASADTTVYDHYAFPDIAKLSDGRFIVDWRAGTTHDQTGAGKILKSFGTADGQTWSAPALLYDDPAKDDRDFSINRLSNGTLLGDFFKWGTGKCSITKSTDDGQNFSPPVDINILSGSANPSSQAEEINGTLWLPTYGTDGNYPNTRVIMFKSPDLGNNWTEELIAPDNQFNLNLQEPCIIKANNNRLIMHVRTANYTPPYGLSDMYQAISDDGGTTWSDWSDLNFIGHAPSLYRTESGILVSTFRFLSDINATLTKVGLIYSIDNGDTWSSIITVASSDYECGYSAIESMGNDKFILVYYRTILINGGTSTQMQINTKIYQFTPIYKMN